MTLRGAGWPKRTASCWPGRSATADARRLTAYGTLYKALDRLERGAMLESRWEESSTPRKRPDRAAGSTGSPPWARPPRPPRAARKPGRRSRPDPPHEAPGTGSDAASRLPGDEVTARPWSALGRPVHARAARRPIAERGRSPGTSRMSTGTRSAEANAACPGAGSSVGDRHPRRLTWRVVDAPSRAPAMRGTPPSGCPYRDRSRCADGHLAIGRPGHSRSPSRGWCAAGSRQTSGVADRRIHGGRFTRPGRDLLAVPWPRRGSWSARSASVGMAAAPWLRGCWPLVLIALGVRWSSGERGGQERAGGAG